MCQDAGNAFSRRCVLNVTERNFHIQRGFSKTCDRLLIWYVPQLLRDIPLVFLQYRETDLQHINPRRWEKSFQVLANEI